MMTHALLLIAKNGYQDIELDGTRKGLIGCGYGIVLGSTEVGECTGKFGGKEQATIAFADVNVADYDRIAFIGGPGAGVLAQNADAKRIAVDAMKAKMPLGAICIAPTILAAAGVLQKKRVTCWPLDHAPDDTGEQVQMLEQGGAIVIRDQNLVVDGLVVTANGPAAAVEFGKTFAKIGKKG